MAQRDSPEERVERALIRLVRRATDPRGNSQLNQRAGVDLERSGVMLLARIHELAPVRLSEIADAAGLDVSTVSRQVARLVELGYVDREVDRHDRRAAVHRLTRSGRVVHDRLAEARREWLRDLLRDLTPDERSTFSTMFEEFVDRLVRSTESSPEEPVG